MQQKKRKVKDEKTLKVREGRWRNWRITQQNKSTGDRNAQLSSEPEARIGTHVAGKHICPALIFCLAQFLRYNNV